MDPRLHELMNGKCAMLALAIHELRGWQLGLVCDDGGDQLVLNERFETLGVIPGPVKHVYVVPPSGGYLDAAGWHEALQADYLTVDQAIEFETTAHIVRQLVANGQLGFSEQRRSLAKRVAEIAVQLVEQGRKFDHEALAARL